MKILHFVSGDLSGGAARGAYWLHLAQREYGIDSTLITDSDVAPLIAEKNVISLKNILYIRVYLIFLNKLSSLILKFYKRKNHQIFNTGFDGIDITKLPAYKDADIIHLHWINRLVNIKNLKKIKKPVVWTMRDMWAITGGCHYSLDCENYMTGCGSCPQLSSKFNWDISYFIAKRKSKNLPKKIVFVGISNWLSKCASQSQILKRQTILTISNAIKVSEFCKLDKIYSRKAINVDINKKVVLVGAQNTNDQYKGFDLLIKALSFLDSKSNILILIFGNSTESFLSKIPFPYKNLGILKDTLSLQIVYSSADIFVAPSRMEAFGKTIVESMSCGTPVVAFNATGPADIITHMHDGYLAKAFDPEDLANGIKWILDLGVEKYKELSISATNKAINNFDTGIIVKEYIKLYQTIK